MTRLCNVSLQLRVIVAAVIVAQGIAFGASSSGYHSFAAGAFHPHGDLFAVADRTGRQVVVFSVKDARLLFRVPCRSEVRSCVWSADGALLYVAESLAGSVAEVNVKSRSVVRRFAVGRYVQALAVCESRNMLLAACAGTDTVCCVDLSSGRVTARIPTGKWPSFVAVVPGGERALVSALLPSGKSTDPTISCSISVIDLKRRAVAKELRLPPGSVTARGIALSPDRKWAYVVHTVGRFSVPTTQLDRGWVNTNALSCINLAKGQVYATVLLDYPSQGAADPYDVVVSPEGDTAWITLSGIHSLATIDLRSLSRLLRGDLSEKPQLRKLGASYQIGTENVWVAIEKDPENRSLLINDLAALYVAGVISKHPVEGKGPRDVALSPQGDLLAVVNYFSGDVRLLRAKTLAEKGVLSAGANPPPDPVRRGEIMFHDAMLCFQQWLSCATCHPEGRADGLNWDLLNDGIGNPKNTKSLVFSHRTPPAMARGVRPTMRAAVEGGFRHILFREPQGSEVEDTSAYLRSLKPLPSPFLPEEGTLSAAARRGKALFEEPEVDCARCHRGPYLTDCRSYDVGTKGEFDRAAEFDTPTLRELWRTAPYLHDGSAATLREVLTARNRHDRHGKTSHLTPRQIEDLLAYLRSL